MKSRKTKKKDALFLVAGAILMLAYIDGERLLTEKERVRIREIEAQMKELS